MSRYYYTEWNTDSSGNKKLEHIQNESHKIVNNKFFLDQIPDSWYKVKINNMFEVTNVANVANETQFKVNYDNGEITFHPNIEGSDITVTEYYGVGLIKISSKRIVFENDGSTIVATDIDGAIKEQNSRIDNIVSNSGVSNQEIVDGRNSSVKNTTYTTLKNRLDTNETDIENINAEIENARKGEVDLLTKINSIDSEIDAHSSQLSENTKLLQGQQYDFVNYLSKISNINSKMTVKIDVGNLKQFSVHAKTSSIDGIAYYFRKDGNDDYITLMEGIFGTLTSTYAITESKNYDSKSGTGFIETYLPNGYTTTIGDYLYAEFIGTKVSFNTYKNNQGGLWRFTLDEGTAGQQQIDVSVYSSSPVTLSSITLFQNLDNKKHTLKGVFQGQDPSNPVGSPRGWYYVGGLRPQDTARTFDVYNDTFYITKTDDMMYSYSNKEFAISCRPFESVLAYQYIPEHNATGTAFNLQDTKLLVDGKEVIWNTGNYYKDVECVQLIQKVKGVHTSDTANPIMEVTTIHTIKNGICTVSGKIKFLRKTSIDVGYIGMLPYFCSFAKKIKTSIDNTYAVITNNPNYKEYWLESDDVISFAIVNDLDTGNKENLSIAMTIDNPYKTFRHDKVGRGNPFSWIEHRSDTMGKIYFQQFQNATMEVGEIYRFDIRYLVCKLDKVNQYLL